MLTNSYRETCIYVLKKIQKKAVQDSTLLQAYVTFQLMNRSAASSLLEAYQFAVLKAGSWSYALLPCSTFRNSSCSWDTFRELIRPFDVSFDFFLCCGVPWLVADRQRFHQFFEQNRISDLAQVAHYLITLKLTSFRLSANSQDFSSFKKNEEPLERLYQVYCQIETYDELRLSKKMFLDLYRAVNLYPLNRGEFWIQYRKNVMQLIHILGDELGEPRSRQLAFASDFYTKNLQQNELFIIYGRPPFAQVQDEHRRKVLLKKALILMAKSSPMDTLCGITLGKKSAANDHGTSSTIIPNDVPLENGIIFSLLESSFSADPDSKDEVIIFFPSPFFVRKWAECPTLTQKRVTFVMQDSNSANLLHFHFSEGSYVKAVNPGISFIGYEDWKRSLTNGEKFRWTQAMIFATGLSQREEYDWIATFKQYIAVPVKLYALISSTEFEESRSPFASESTDSGIHLHSLLLIPQGINNSAYRKRKLFLEASYGNKLERTTENVRLYSLSLNRDFKVQALAQRHLKHHPDYLTVNQGELAKLNRSIRQLFDDEAFDRKASGRQKNMPFSYEFTPEIIIWCSKSYPKANHGNPRLDAYICELPDARKVLRGYLERGPLIPETLKRTTACSDDTAAIMEWLETVYPFSYRSGRISSSKIKSGSIADNQIHEKAANIEVKQNLSIREAIIEKTSAWFCEKSISLKTLWYIYPCLVDLMSAQDYHLLSEMVMTELGKKQVEEITEEWCVDALVEQFPELPQEQILRRCNILYMVLDFACQKKHCTHNPLRQLVLDEHHSKKMLSKIRSNLAIRSLTEAELQAVFQAILEKLEIGKAEYLGVLIRLLTGLESNIVCALKWGNFQAIADYGIYSLIIRQQVTNDGVTLCGFDNSEDYRILPCCKILSTFLLRQKSGLLSLLSQIGYDGIVQNFPILSKKDAQSLEEFEARLSPNELEQISKEILSAAKIDDHVIAVPDFKKGRKETNVAHYQGDFFRENFKYWAQEFCKVTPDELAYLVGNIPLSTFGRFYCDFKNDASQLVLFVKLQRLNAVLTHSENAAAVRKAYRGQSDISHTFTSSYDKPLYLHLYLSSENGSGNVQLDMQTRFGANSSVVSFSEE